MQIILLNVDIKLQAITKDLLFNHAVKTLSCRSICWINLIADRIRSKEAVGYLPNLNTIKFHSLCKTGDINRAYIVVLPQDIVKSRSLAIECYSDHIALNLAGDSANLLSRFCRRIGSHGLAEIRVWRSNYLRSFNSHVTNKQCLKCNGG